MIAFELSVAYRGQPVLARVAADVPNNAVVALMGPGGSGKSAVLRALAGMKPREGITTEGLVRIGPHSAAEACACGASAYLPQAGRTGAAAPVDPATVLARADYVFLDEPPLSDALGRDLRRHEGTTIIVTHHQAFARTWCDYVLFARVGGAEPMVEAETFFRCPPSELAAQFVGRGSCASVQRDLEPPSHFFWLLPNRLAGMGRPGLNRDADEDLASIAGLGVRAVVNLTEQAGAARRLSSHGLTSLHVPVADMGVPSYQAAASVCRFVDDHTQRGAAVVLHCRAGLGRTGTLLACCLVWSGHAASAAIDQVRAAQRLAIQTRGQVRFIESFARRYAGGGEPGVRGA